MVRLAPGVTSPAVTRFRLSARVSSANPAAVKAALVVLLPQGSVSDAQGDLLIEAELPGASAKVQRRFPELPIPANSATQSD